MRNADGAGHSGKPSWSEGLCGSPGFWIHQRARNAGCIHESDLVDASAMLLSTPAATTTSVHGAEQLLFFVLLQLVLILVLARLAGSLARRLGQPRVVGEIIGGLMLGPSLFGRLFPDLFDYIFNQPGAAVPVNVLSQIGLILLMFQIGLDFDFSHLRERANRRIVLVVSAVSILLPFAIGFGIAHAAAPHLASEVDPLAFRLFMATAFSITAIPILGRLMVEFGLTRTRLGAVAITSASGAR